MSKKKVTKDNKPIPLNKLKKNYHKINLLKSIQIFKNLSSIPNLFRTHLKYNTFKNYSIL